MMRLKIRRKPKLFWAEKFTADMPHRMDTLGAAVGGGLVYSEWKCPEGISGGVPVIEYKGKNHYISSNEYIIRDLESGDILEILDSSVVSKDYEVIDTVEIKEPVKPEPEEQDDPDPDTKKKS